MTKRTRTTEYLNSITFKSMVDALNEKFGHTYGQVDDNGNEIKE